MVALKMRAFDQFSDTEVQVTIGEEEKMDKIKTVLNRFCYGHPQCNRDVKMTEFLNHSNNNELLIDNLVKQANITNEQAVNLLNRVRDCCVTNYVYVYSNMFSISAI